MGSAGSKAAGAAAAASALPKRKFPTSIPQATANANARPERQQVYDASGNTQTGPQRTEARASEPQERPVAARISEAKDAGIEQDGKDPQFLQMLRQAGPVQYKDAAKTINLGLENQRQQNPTSIMFEARSRLKMESDQLDDRPGEHLRKTLEMSEILAVLDARKAGVAESEIERRYSLDPSVLPRLGFGINTPTESGKKDDLGNVKGIWLDPSEAKQ